MTSEWFPPQPPPRTHTGILPARQKSPHAGGRTEGQGAAVDPCELALHLPLPIHYNASLCGTATCRPSARRVDGLASYPLAPRRTFYARSWMRSSQNPPSTHSGEYRVKRGRGLQDRL